MAKPESTVKVDTYTQDNRGLALSPTKLGKDALLLESFEGVEAISQMFEFNLNVLNQTGAVLKFEDLLGEKVTFSMSWEQVKDSKLERFFNGIVVRVSEGESFRGAVAEKVLYSYQLQVVPTIWKLTRKFRNRIFQSLSVVEILKEVLDGHNFKFEGVEADYVKRDYCVQYQESDFAFASRLMEEEGLFYFFVHSDGDHQMVIADKTDSYRVVAAKEGKYYFGESEATDASNYKGSEVIDSWNKHQEIRSGKITVWDECFERPRNISSPKNNNFEKFKETLADVKAGTVTHKLAVATNSELEKYEFPGSFAKHFDGIDSGGTERTGKNKAGTDDIDPTGERFVGIRMEEETLQGLLVEGIGRARTMVAGGKFVLAQHFNANGEWLLTQVVHKGNVGSAYRSKAAQSMLVYIGFFRAIPTALPYRPHRTTPRPIIRGTQTATVVGPAGQEISTDKYGRIKVQFHWDRGEGSPVTGKMDQNSSCWIRVATPWAGRGWGAIYIPRVGQEVLVNFLEGDPDQPVVIGCLYNADQSVPYDLPSNMSVSGIKTNSTLGGVGFNELRFEDLKDHEQIFVHAQRDYDVMVVKDMREHILHDRHEIVGIDGEEFGNYYEQITLNKHRIIKKDLIEHLEGNVLRFVGLGNNSAGGNIDETVEKNETRQIKGDQKILIGPDTGNMELTVKGERKELIEKAAHLHCKDAWNEKTDKTHSLTVGADWQVKVTGATGIESTGDVYIKGANVVIEAGTALCIKVGGNFVNISSSSVDIVGSKVNINSGGAAGSGTAPAPVEPTDPAAPAPKEVKALSAVDVNILTASKDKDKKPVEAVSGFQSSEGKGGGDTEATDKYKTKFPKGTSTNHDPAPDPTGGAS